MKFIRSLLFVPGDRPDRIEKAFNAGADAVILDLEDSVLPAAKPRARDIVGNAVLNRKGKEGPACWVRINALDSTFVAADVAALAGAPPEAVLLPKVTGAADVLDVAARLDEAGVPPETGICPVTTETPAALFALGSYIQAGSRLCALTWGAEDLATALGAFTNRDENGEWLFIHQLSRALCLAGAAAAGVPAIETIAADFRDEAAIERAARCAARDGFTGMMAIHPAQIAPINRAFTPDEASLARARAVLAAFAARPDAGAVSLDGKMLDIPHLKQAERLLSRARAFTR